MEHWIGKCRRNWLMRCSCRYKLYLVPSLPVARLGEGKTVGSVSTQVPPLSWVSWGWLSHRSSEGQADPPLPPFLLAGMNEEWLPDRETEWLLTLLCAQLDGLGERETTLCKGLTDHGSWLGWWPVGSHPQHWAESSPLCARVHLWMEHNKTAVVKMRGKHLYAVV